MSTDVFNNFWNNPKKQYVYTDLTCANSKSDDELSFNINEGAAEISNNNEVLSSVDLSSISSSLSTYTKSSKTIPANSLLYIGGETFGKSYKKVVFGKIKDDVVNDLDWQSYVRIMFVISCIRKDNIPSKIYIDAKGTIDKDVIDEINDKLNENEINVSISLISLDSKNYNVISFDSNKEGYDFYIDNISYYIPMDIEDEFVNDVNYEEYPLEEVDLLYIPAYKYRNGAYKGILIKPTYPLYNNDIEEENKSLKVTHIKDRIAVFVKNGRGEYFKKILDVFGNHFDVNEYSSCILFKDEKTYINDDLDDSWLNDEENDWVTLENGYRVLRNNYCGLYGFANYATINDLWHNFGDVYMSVSNDDNPASEKCNLITPVVLYNPNNFDVKVDILTFV